LGMYGGMDTDISRQSNRIWFDRLTQDIMVKSASINIFGGDGFTVKIPVQWLTAASPLVKSMLSDLCLCSTISNYVAISVPCATKSSLWLISEMFCSGKSEASQQLGSTLNLMEEIQCILSVLGVDKKFKLKLFRSLSNERNRTKKNSKYPPNPACQPSTNTHPRTDSTSTVKIDFKSNPLKLLAERKRKKPEEINNNERREVVSYDDNIDISSQTKQIDCDNPSIKKLTVNLKNCLDVGIENKAERIKVLKVKSEAQSYICNICGYQFARRATLRKHQRLRRCFSNFHKRFLEPLHKCPWCSKQFRNAGKLEKHLQQAHIDDQPNKINEDKIHCKDIENVDSQIYLSGASDSMSSRVQNDMSESCLESRTRRLDYNAGDVDRYGCGECNYVSKSRSKVKSHCKLKGDNYHLIYMYLDLPALS